jgi:hypothetical protein
MQAEPFRSPAIVTAAVEYGRVLSAAEFLRGHRPVLARLRQGEVAAFAELEVATVLHAAGMSVSLEPQLNGKRLDVLVSNFERPVYIEVIAPAPSDYAMRVNDVAFNIARAVGQANLGASVQVTYLRPPGVEDLDSTVRLAQAAALGSVTFDSVMQCHMSKQPWFAGASCHIAPVIEVESDPLNSCALSGPGHHVVLHYPLTDSRAKRLFAGELHHFTRGECNVLMVDVSRIQVDMESWIPAVARRFQPKQNQRVSAVVLWAASMCPRPWRFRRRWRGILNPHALARLPDGFHRDIQVLPQSWT